MFTITPIHLCNITGDRSNMVYLRHFGVKQEFPCIIWYLKSGNCQIMVDTGPCDPEWSAKYHWPMTRLPEQEPENALRLHGVDPTKIDKVIMSHLHWDHAFNNHLFPNAEFIVQKAELQYGISPLPIHMGGYEVMQVGMQPDFWTHTKYTVIDGDCKIVPGVEVIHTPGHSPGSQCILVDTVAGKYIIASDTIPTYENWNDGPIHMPHIPNTIHVGLEEYFASLEKIEKVKGIVLPGHDSAVLEHPVYPY